jgi:hypothetical protein
VTHFPVDAPKVKVIKAFELLGFSLVREREHVAMIRENADETRTPLTLPNHKKNQGLYPENHLHPSRHTQGRVFEGISQYLIAFFLAPSFYFAVLRKTGSLLSSL